ERRIRQLSAMNAAQVGPAARHRAGEGPRKRLRIRVETVPGTAQPPELFDQLALPAGDVRDEFFENARSACATPVIDRLGHIHSAAAEIQSGYQTGCHEFADIRNGPLRAQVDELIVP